MPATAIRPTIDEKVAFLSAANAYREKPAKVEVIETHMSWVFLTPRYAYKLKKPVHNQYFDFRTLAARLHNCCEEVRLNRRLAPDIYLGVQALTVEHDAQLKVGGRGEPIEYLVQMKRLPGNRMLDRLLDGGELTARDVDAVSDVLLDFYRHSQPVHISSEQYRQRYQQYVDIQIREITNPLFQLSHIKARRVSQHLTRYISQARTMGVRAAHGCLVEAHGDLRPEHICVIHPPVIIDCLEFSQELRTLDPLDELAFLSLECEMEGAAWVGNRILTTYLQALPDPPAPPSLVAFYKCYRALLRTKLSARHLSDATVTRRDHWVAKAKHYLDAADRYANEF